MLPRILCHSAGIVRRTRGQHNELLISAFQNLSTKSDDGSGNNRAVAKDKKDIEKDKPAHSVSAVNHKLQQPDAQQPLLTPAAASAILSPQILSTVTPPTEPSATKIVSNIPKDPQTDGTLTSPKQSDTTVHGNALASYYDKAFHLWSERSGTTEIMALKESVNEAGSAFDTASAAVTTSRRNLDDALRKWERASGQHLQLLQRRESWTPEDAQRFADFVSLEITRRTELEQTRHDLRRSEEILTKSQLDYINKMRRQYHEEQIWQDQWRVLGTYGTWTLIVLNSCVFLGSQFFQRRREQDRTETIKRLIQESTSDEIRTKAQIVPFDQESSKMPAKAIVVVEAKTEKSEESTTNIKEDDTSTKSEEEPISDDPSILERNETLEAKDDEQKKKHPAMERIEATAVSVGLVAKRWENKCRSGAKKMVGSMNQRLYQVLPADIPNEFPKSVSEIHVPSAVIGASVGGIAALTISTIFSNRRY